MDLISVVVPVYNLQDCIEACMKSLQAQTYENFEVLLIDDGSADRSRDICAAFAEKDPRFHVLSQENQGVSTARNHGIRAATGAYLCFVDGDDVVEPTFLEVLHRQITAEEDVDMGLCGVEMAGKNTVHGGSQQRNGIWTREQVIEGLFAPDSVKGYLVNKIFRRSIIKEHDLALDTTAHICEDALFCLEYAMHIRKARFANAPLYHYVIRTGSATKAGFQPKLLSVVPTLDKIRTLAGKLGNPGINSRVEVSRIIMNMFVFRSILKSGRGDLEKELAVTGRNLLPGYKYLLRGGMPLAEKVKYLQVVLYLITHPGTLEKNI